ncbi:SH3 domain-containing protein [Halomonas sp. ATBC28]|uniref:SH3 domain-containing protein n=1 Tax=Halomonadaceae TaxID=28256 RepID=UPI00110D411D|nr:MULTISPECIES: SH3 domain-containing protein [Halomonas]NVE89585.1 SH3 domain-containing protein [Halomonas titanicae]TMU14902.1 SH3 domain-containing protein [Halomonas sp. ATBC28]
MGKIILYVIVGGLAALYAMNFFSSTSKFILIAEAPTAVYEDFPASGLPSAQVIGVMSKGEVARIFHAEYSKDFMYYKVQLPNGVEGYVLWTVDVTVQPAKKN